MNNNNNQICPAKPDLVIDGGLILTMVEEQNLIHEGRVYITDGIISDVRDGCRVEREDLEGLELIDAKDCLVMPGLMNSHTHAAMTLFRGYADDLPLQRWLFEKIFPAEARSLNRDTVYWGSLLACLEMIGSGTTSFIDGYFFQDETARAASEAGMRAIIAQGVIDFPAPGVPDPDDNIKIAGKFVDRWAGVSDLIKPGLFCHSPLTCSELTMKRAREVSDEYQLPLQIHLSETRDEVAEIKRRTGMKPVHYLNSIGLLNGKLIAAHAVHVDDGEMELLKEKRVKIVHLPESNMKLGSGVAPVTEMSRKGIALCLGTDGCSSNNDLDMFLEMDTAAKLSKVIDFDPVGLDAGTVLKMATSGCASYLGCGDSVGKIKKGNVADIIIIDLNKPHLCPIYDPVSTIVYSANGSDVRDVIVNGRVLMRDRNFMTLNPDEIMDKVKKICASI